MVVPELTDGFDVFSADGTDRVQVVRGRIVGPVFEDVVVVRRILSLPGLREGQSGAHQREQQPHQSERGKCELGDGVYPFKD